MHYQWEMAGLFLDRREPFKVQLRLHALGIRPVSGAHSDRQTIHAGQPNEFRRGFRFRQGCAAVGFILICHTDMAQLRFHGNPQSVSQLNDFLHFPDILFKRARRPVDHHGCKTCPEGFQHFFFRSAVIEVNRNRNGCPLGEIPGNLTKQKQIRIGRVGNIQDQWRPQLLSSVDHRPRV